MMKSKLILKKQGALSVPREFSLKKYDQCKKWGLAEWYQAIKYRAFLQDDWNKSVNRVFDNEDHELVHSSYKYAAIKLLTDPITVQLIHDNGGHKKFVRDYSVADLFEDGSDERLINSEWYDDFLEWKNLDLITRYCNNEDIKMPSTTPKKSPKLLVDTIECTPSWEMKKSIYGATQTAIININLSGSDEELVKQFKSWLKVTRKHMKLLSRTPASDNIFSDWHLDRILPCFDLLFYETIFNGAIKRELLVDTLFPYIIESKSDITLRTRRNTISATQKIISFATAAQLRSQLDITQK